MLLHAVQFAGRDRMHYSLTESLAHIGRVEWNHLAAASAGFYSSYDWLLVTEGHPAATPHYALAHDDTGRLVGALPAYLVAQESNERYLPNRLDLPAAGTAPWLVFGNRRGYRSGLLVSPELPDGRQIATGLLEQVWSAVGRRNGYFYYVPESAVATTQLIPGTRCTRELATDAFLEVPDDGFDGFVAQFTKGRRQNLRRERRAFLAAGYDVEVEMLTEIVNDVAPLLHQLELKYGRDRPLDQVARYYERLCDSADPGRVLTARRQGIMVGFCHYYLFGDTLWARTTGFDYPQLEGAFEYFNIAYYELVEQAAACGARKVHLGLGSLQAKVNHGANTEALWAVGITEGWAG